MKKLLSLLLFSLCLINTAGAQAGKRQAAFNLAASSLAIEGYDPVAYFTQHKAVEGSKANALQHQGVTYYFATAKNREAFQANPAGYEPQYGGWCAYAMGAKGEKVPVDPETFKIVNGKLYLFYNKLFTNTLKLWNKEEASLKPKADAHWMRYFQ